MFFKTHYHQVIIIILLAVCAAACKGVPGETTSPSTLAPSATARSSPTGTMIPTVTPSQPTPTLALSAYAFPVAIDKTRRYLFYLHGKIVEDQGLLAISPDFGEYEYLAILEKLNSSGFVVISEQRPKDADSEEYARRIAAQVKALLDAGVPAKNITVVGASKGASITMLASHLIGNEEVNFVILAGCNPEMTQSIKQNQAYLYGNVLSIYDSADKLANSCQEVFSLSEGKGLARHDEVVLKVGTGHGILYKPLDEWITPVIQWAGK